MIKTVSLETAKAFETEPLPEAVQIALRDLQNWRDKSEGIWPSKPQV